MKKTIYYQDELNDDFAKMNVDIKPVDEKYKYVHSCPVWRFFSWFVYNIIAKPLSSLFLKFVFLTKVKNRKVLRKANRKVGYFLYLNHTQVAADAFIPTKVSNRKKNYILVSPTTTSIPGIKNLVQMLGAVPLASTYKKQKEMLKCIDKIIKDKSVVAIYPEAHIWPYYTKIREFGAGSFIYPVKFNTPVFAATTCYKKRLFSRRPRIVTYVDGPFYPNKELSQREAMEELRNNVFNAMNERAEKESNYEYIKYVKQEKME